MFQTSRYIFVGGVPFPSATNADKGPTIGQRQAHTIVLNLCWCYETFMCPRQLRLQNSTRCKRVGANYSLNKRAGMFSRLYTVTCCLYWLSTVHELCGSLVLCALIAMLYNSCKDTRVFHTSTATYTPPQLSPSPSALLSLRNPQYRRRSLPPS